MQLFFVVLKSNALRIRNIIFENIVVDLSSNIFITNVAFTCMNDSRTDFFKKISTGKLIYSFLKNVRGGLFSSEVEVFGRLTEILATLNPKGLRVLRIERLRRRGGARAGLNRCRRKRPTSS